MESEIEVKNPIRLADQIHPVEGEVVNKTLLKNGAGIVKAVSFAKGSCLTPHTADGDVVVTVVSGKLNFAIEGNNHELKGGDAIVMPAKTEHTVTALEDSIVVLTKIK